jgi:RNA polymerase sigma-70 factor, ECF subfamily
MDNEFVLHAYEHYGSDVTRYATALERDVADGEDLAQEAFMRLAQETADGVAPVNVRAWLFRVVRNLHVDGGRRETVANKHADRVYRAQQLIACSAEDEVIVRQRDADLHGLLAALDPIDQRALVMAALGYTSAEIGHRVGRNENAVRVRLFRARAQLRGQLAPAAADAA